MKNHSLLWTLTLLGAFTVGGCSPSTSTKTASDSKAAEVEVTTLPNGEPSIVTVQHCLIGFDESMPGKGIRRKQADAEQLAQDLLKLLQAGDDFDEIIHQYTDDSAPGIYSMTNIGVTAPPGSDAMPRDGMVQSFGDVSFGLKVGEYGIAPYDPAKSKFGWHIIKRLK